MVTRRRVGGSSATYLDGKSVSTCCADFSSRVCRQTSAALIGRLSQRGNGSICGGNANEPNKSNQVTKDQLRSSWWRSLVDVVRVEMNQKFQSKVGKAPRYRRKMRRMHWQPSTQRQANEGLILTKRGNAVAYWPAGWSSTRLAVIDAVTSNRPRAEERARPPACHETQNLHLRIVPWWEQQNLDLLRVSPNGN